MAKKFLTDLDLMKNQLKQAVIEHLAVAPEGAKLGQVYFDTLKSQFGVCVAIDEAGVRTWAYMSSVAELEAGLATKVDASSYATDKEALELAIDGKVAQGDYDTKVAALEAKDEELAGAIADLEAKDGELAGQIATKVETEAYNAKVSELEGKINAKVAQADYDAKMALLDAEDQKAAEHIANGDIHVTAEQKDAWTAKQDALTEAQLDAVNSGITAEKIEALDAKDEELAGAIADLDEATYSKDEVDAIVEGINTAIESSLPAQAGQAGKALVTDGTDAKCEYVTVIKD